jgi:hypothetical protein
MKTSGGARGVCIKLDEVYREELKLYRKNLILDDVRVGKVESLLEARTGLGTGGDPLSRSMDTRSIGIINELFSWEAERGGVYSVSVNNIFVDYLAEGRGGEAEQKGSRGGRFDYCCSKPGGGEKDVGLVAGKKELSGTGLPWSVEPELGVGRGRVPREAVVGGDREDSAVGGLKIAGCVAGSPGLHSSRGEVNFRAGLRRGGLKKLNLLSLLVRDIGMEEVGSYYLRGLVGRFGYGAMAARDIHEWAEDNWGSVLGYSSEIYVLIKGWYCFLFKSAEDVELVLNRVWVVKNDSLMLKRWHLTFNPEKEHIRFRHLCGC